MRKTVVREVYMDVYDVATLRQSTACIYPEKLTASVDALVGHCELIPRAVRYAAVLRYALVILKRVCDGKHSSKDKWPRFQFP